ncbi:MAG: T9SS type B sorting domain-containing protein [Bacteroidota bacterium]
MSTQKNNYVKIAAVLLLFLSTYSTKLYSQCRDVVLNPAGPTQNAFGISDFVEVGVSDCGTYGTRATAWPPPNPCSGTGVWYSTTGLSGIGFLADPGRDGWTVGSPALCGDYFLPGSPVEGFGVSVNGNDAYNDSRCGTYQIPGAVISGAHIGLNNEIVWEGLTTGTLAGLRVHQTTSVPDGALYFVTKVDLTNTTSVPMNNVIYVRSVDPDNEQPLPGGSFTTRNTVASQPNASNCDALVTAVGLTYSCYLGIGARSQNARVGVGGFGTVVTPLSSYYTTSRDTTTGHLSTSDEAISIMFNWPTIAPGQTVTAAFAHILSASDLAVALEATGGAFIYSDSADITPTLSDTICPGDYKELRLSADTQYRWTWTPNYNIDTLAGYLVNVHPDTTTTYTAIGINGPCGTIIRTITLYVDTNVNVNAGPDDTICLGGSAQLRATRASFFTWTPSATLNNDTIDRPIATPTVTTTYIASSNCGLDSVTVFVAPNYTIAFPPDTAICWNDSIPLYAIPSLGSPSLYDYQWSPANFVTNDSINTPWTRSVPNTRTFNLHVRSFGGCESDTSVTISIRGYRPIVNIIADTVPFCPGTVVPMFASAVSGNCDRSYTVSDIAYTPIAGSGTAITLGDNQLSSYLPLGFSFPFFCDFQDSLRISSNGFLTFSRLANDGCCSGQLIPSVTQPNGVIAGCWTNLNPSLPGNSIDYRTIGTAPNRQFIVNFNDVPIRDFFGVRTGAVKQQYVLNETSGIIDIHTTLISGMTSYFGTMGIENMAGNSALAAPGKNQTQWSDTLHSRRWDPNIRPLTYSWTPPIALSSTDSAYTTAIVGPTRTYQVVVSDSGCTGTDFHSTLEDTTLRITSFPNNDTLCSPGTIPLCATVVYDSLNHTVPYCDRYTVRSIAYAPLAGSGTAISLSDDQLSAAIPIGFNFGFFCQSKSQLKISSNGFITFDIASFASGCCSGQVLPNNFAPNDVIACGWDDLYPPGGGGGRIEYYTTGVAPNRRFVVNYNDIPLCCGTVPAYKGQLILFETSNVIEVHNSYANNLNPATLGIENSTGTLGLAAPGRNGSNWGASIVNESWRFAPDSFIVPPRVLDYDWSPTSGLSDSNSLCPTATVNRTTTYILHVTDGVCDKYDTVTIIVDSLPYTISNDTAICYGSSVNLLATATNRATYSWTPTTALVPGGSVANPVSTPLSNITYSLTITDTLGCSKTDSVNIIVHPKIPIALTPSSTYICNGDSVLYDATNPAFTSYAWSPSGTASTYTATTTGNYSVIATDSFGCKDTSNRVYLRVVPIPTPNITATDDSFCIGASVTLSYTGATGTSTNIWTPTGGSSSSNVVTVAGTYYMTITDSGCVGVDSFDVYEKFPPVLNPLNDTTMCCGQTKDVSPYSEVGATYSWSTPFSTSTANPITLNAPGTYSVTVTAANGCTATESLDFATVCLNAIASISPDSQFVNTSSGLSVSTTAGYTVTYSWTPATYLSSATIQNPVATSLSTTPDHIDYTVYVTDSVTGCRDTAGVTMYILPLGFYAIPGAFTPNGDGLNDNFYPVLSPGATVLEFRVFDRWGNIVYDGPTAPGWDGTFLGTPQPIGTYVYYVRVQHPDPADASVMLEDISNGTISLIR